MKAFVLTLLLISQVKAAEVEQLLQAAHYDVTRSSWDTTYNNNTPGIGYASKRWVTGIYHNSFNKTTWYVARRTPVNRHFGYEVGLATGYEDLYGLPLQPLVDVYVQYNHIKLRIIPGAVTTLGLSLTWKIK